MEAEKVKTCELYQNVKDDAAHRHYVAIVTCREKRRKPGGAKKQQRFFTKNCMAKMQNLSVVENSSYIDNFQPLIMKNA
jgi:hypothetical protein